MGLRILQLPLNKFGSAAISLGCVQRQGLSSGLVTLSLAFPVGFFICCRRKLQVRIEHMVLEEVAAQSLNACSGALCGCLIGICSGCIGRRGDGLVGECGRTGGSGCYFTAQGEQAAQIGAAHGAL